MASGEYIAFVDSDDWIEHDMYETLHTKAVFYNADITTCGCIVVKDGKYNLQYAIPEDIVYSSEEALRELLKDQLLKSFPCMSLYRRKLFAKVRYPLRAAYEDLATTYKLFASSNKIVLLNDYKYYYLYRSTGLSKLITFSLSFDFFKSLEERYNYLKELLPDTKNQLFSLMISRVIYTYNLGLKARLSKEEKLKRNEILKFIKALSPEMIIGVIPRVDETCLKLIGKYRTLYKMLYLVNFFIRDTIYKYTRLISFMLTVSNYLLKAKGASKNSVHTIFLIAPAHNNMGNHLAALACKEFLKENFPEHRIEEISEENLLPRLFILRRRITNKDYIVFGSGGSSGNLYPQNEAMRRTVVKAFPYNKIIMFPHTIFYSKDIKGEEQLRISKGIYKSHKDLVIMARDHYSYELCREHFKNNVILLAPDIALSMDKTDTKIRRKGAAICLRNDVDKKITDEEHLYISNNLNKYYDYVLEIDTYADRGAYEDGRLLVLNAKLRQFEQAELVITDRLYGMIFSAITNTPCIVLDTKYNKISGNYKWLKNLKYIQYMDDIETLEEKIKYLRSLNMQDIHYDNDFTKEYNALILESIS